MVNLTPDEARMLALDTTRRNERDAKLRELARPAEPEDALDYRDKVLRKYATPEEFGIVALIQAVAQYRGKFSENPHSVDLSPQLYARLCQILHVLAIPEAANLKVRTDDTLKPHQYVLRGARNG